MVTLARRVERVPFAPVVAAMFGAVAAILVAATPQVLFENAVVATGLPSVIAAAAPPLGTAARTLAIFTVFAAVAAMLWLVLDPATRSLEKRSRTPWRDAGYDVTVPPEAIDAFPRRPIFAPVELGAPLMSDAAIAPPMIVPEPELEAQLTPLEFGLPPSIESEDDDSIHGLIRRLEVGIARRTGTDPDPADAAPLALERAWIVDDANAAPQPDKIDGWNPDDPALSAMKRLAWR